MNRILVAVLAVVALVGGCERAETSGSASGDKKIRVAMLPKKVGVPYFTTCADGAKACAQELGDVELIYDGPTDGSAEKAATMIEKWALQGVDVVAVSVNDADVLAGAMKKAREKGTRVITWDADAAPETREFFVNQATPKDIGYALVDTLAKDIAGSADPKQAAGEVAIVTASLNAPNQNEWMKHMKERLAAEYPKLQLVATQPSNEDQKQAFQVSQDLIKAYPNLKGIWAISSVAFPGAAEAIKQANKAGQVQVTGLSTPNDMRSFVNDGTVKSVILWNTNDLGYLTVQVASQLAKGTLKPGADSINAGRLGEKKIVGDSVLLGDIMVFNKENIGQHNF